MSQTRFARTLAGIAFLTLCCLGILIRPGRRHLSMDHDQRNVGHLDKQLA